MPERNCKLVLCGKIDQIILLDENGKDISSELGEAPAGGEMDFNIPQNLQINTLKLLPDRILYR